MKLLGSLTDYIQSIFKKDGQDITVRPNNSTTFTTSQTLDLPPPDGDNADVIVGEAATQTLTNKTLTAPNVNEAVNLTATSTELNQLDGVTLGGNAAGDVVTTDASQTLTNKTLDADNNVISNLAHGAEVDSPASGVHGVTGNVVGTTDTQTLTNKTIDGDDNTVQDLALSSLKTTVNTNVFIQRDGSGDAIDSTKAVPSGDVVGTSDTQTLTSKTINADNNTISNIDDDEIKAAAGIQLSKLAALTAGRATETNGGGEIVASNVTATELGRLSGVTSGIQDQLNNKQDELITTRGDIIYGDATGTSARLPLGASGTVLTSDGTDAAWSTPAGTGDVTAALNIADNALVRGDGGAKGIQGSGISVDDSNNISGVGTLSASGDMDIGTDILFVDVSEEAVGIGTAAPASSVGRTGVLHLQGNTLPGLRLESTNGTFPGDWEFQLAALGGPNEAALILTEGGSTNVVTFRTSGSVGIGITTPAALLHVAGNGRFGGTDVDASNVVEIRAGSFGVADTATLNLFNSAGSAGFDLTFNNNSGDLFISSDTVSNIMTLERTTGNVGILETEPLAPLHITRLASGATTTGLLLENANGTSNQGISIDFKASNTGGTTASINAQRDGSGGTALRFLTSNTVAAVPTEKMVILDSGEVAIGISAASLGKLQVEGGTGIAVSTGNVLRYRLQDTSNGFFIGGGILAVSNGTNALRYNSGTGVVSIDASTRLVKENIVDSVYGLAEILQLQPRQYTMIGSGDAEVGLIADEVSTIIPEVVAQIQKSFFTEVEEDTEMIPGNVDYSRLTAVLIKAVQELAARVEALESP